MTVIPPKSKAVFLSYAAGNTSDARKIAEALRRKGLEVWFDQFEARSGEGFVRKTHRQIERCALFLPIISSQTQHRGVGESTLEWDLAAQRLTLAAEDRPALAPVVVDDTQEEVAKVPKEFFQAIWFRLPGGEPTPKFVDQIKLLLEQPDALAAPTAATAAPKPAGAALSPAVKVAAVVGVAAVAAGVFALFRKKKAAGSAEKPPAA